MDISTILTQLKGERARIDAAISALEGLGSRTGRGPGRPAGSYKKAAGGKRRTMSPAARKRISEMMKKRWAERKKAGKA